MDINRLALAAMFTGFQAAFQRAFEGAPTDWNQIAMRIPSKHAAETYAWLRASTQFREWVGDRVIQNLATSDFTLKNKRWENTVAVARTSITDDSYGVFSPLVEQLGMDSKQHPDLLVFNLLKAGFTTPCYDGQYFFDTDHPVMSGDGFVSVSNSAGGSGAPWVLIDDTRALKPIIYQVRQDYNFVSLMDESDPNVFMRDEFLYGVDGRSNVGFGLWQLAYGSKQTLDAANYAAARTAMMSMVGDNGRPLGLRPTLLLTGPANEQAAKAILQAETLSNGATNVNRNTAKLLVSPWFG